MAHKAADGTAGMHGQSDTLQNEPQACVLRIGGCVYKPLSLRLLIWKLGGYSGNSLFTWSDGGAWLA